MCRIMPSSLRGQDVVVHAGSPFFGPIGSRLFPGVNVGLHIYKISFDQVFEAEMGPPSWTLVSALPVQDVFRNATVIRSANVA